MGEDSVTIALEGELDTHEWRQLRDTIVDSAGQGTSSVILDLDKVTFFDSSCVRALLGAREELEGRGVTIYLGPCSRIVGEVVEITGIGEVFPSWPPVPAG